jgi:LysM repeat protein
VAQVYTVQSGDTLSGIAIRNGVTTEAILTLNNLTLAQGRQLRPGQQLLIPVRAAPAGALQLPTATAAPEPGTVLLAAPILLAPASGAVLPCTDKASFTWASVPDMQDDDLYELHLGYVDADDAVVWVAQPQRAAGAPAWTADSALCELAASTSGEWRWWVEVTAGTGADRQPVSQPSEIRSFVWR